MDDHTIPRLTEREIQVLRLVAHGLTNKEIAYTLKIKERTVEFHLSQVFDRLAVVSRAAAGVKAEKLGLLEK